MTVTSRTLTLRRATIKSTDRSTPHAMTSALALLVTLIAAGALVAAIAGVFWQAGDGTVTGTTIRGETVELYGRGVYQYDSTFKAAGNRGTDVVTLAVALPLLVVSLVLYRRGSLRGGLVLMGTLVWFLYVYATLAVGTAYNDFFLIYVALFSASLFAFILAFREMLPISLREDAPRRGPAIFMLASGLVTLAVWLMSPLGTLFGGGSPDGLESGTTLVTHALDIAVIVPAAILAGVLILRRATLGYVIALSLLVLEVLLAPMIALQTAFQLAAGVSFTTAEIVGPIAGFTVLALVAIWLLVILLRHAQGEAHAPVGAG